MSGQNKGIWALIIILAAAAIVFTTRKGKQQPQPATEAKSGTELKRATDEERQNLSSPTQGNTLEGTLRASDNRKKGNLMITAQGRTLYISTSRDYSALIGKEVAVTYEGTMDEFVLGDIVAK